MKKLILCLFLIGCSSNRVIEKPKSILHVYNCVSVMVHGVYARWRWSYVTDKDAINEAIVINNNLIKQNLIPDSCIPTCYKDEPPYNLIFPEQK